MELILPFIVKKTINMNMKIRIFEWQFFWGVLTKSASKEEVARSACIVKEIPSCEIGIIASSLDSISSMKRRSLSAGRAPNTSAVL
ncbi:hypothetical protein D3C81_1851290 [compost metagenome]